MVMQRAVLLTSLAALLTACEKDPTGSLPTGGPLFASAGSPRFTEATATAPDALGAMAIAFRMGGVGSKAANVVTATGTGDVVWACRFGSQEFDGFPAPQIVSQAVNGTSSLAMKNGQVSGVVSLSTPAGNTLNCAAGNHAPVMVSTSFDGVQIHHAEAGSLPIIGTFNRSFFTLPTETLPIFTDVQAASTTFTIEGDRVDYTATIQNSGAPLSSIAVQAWITQGTAWRAAGGAAVDCGGASGDLPTGECIVQRTAGARNDPAAGSGTLVPGPAVLEINLRGSPSVRVLAGWRINVTLQ